MGQDGQGYKKEHFWSMPQSREAKLELAHVTVLRIYSTAAFKVINMPLRAGAVHPCPVTIAFLAEAINRLRAVGADEADAQRPLDLWRGLADVSITDEFIQSGGTELAPMVTCSEGRSHTQPCLSAYIQPHSHVLSISMCTCGPF